jgi:hypothetical protein
MKLEQNSLLQLSIMGHILANYYHLRYVGKVMELRNTREVQLRLGREMHMPRMTVGKVWKARPWKTQKEIKSPQN